MYDDYSKLTNAQQRELYKTINKNYTKTIKDIDERVKLISKQKGKEQRQSIKAITPIIVALWRLNGKEIITTGESIMTDSWLFYEYSALKLQNQRILLTNKEISKMITKTLEKRMKVIKWDKVINGNAKRLDKKVRNIVAKSIKNDKTARQIQAELEKTLKLNRGKAKAIARTETNFYKSESKLQVGNHHEKNGMTIIKTWVYTYLSNEHRSHHIEANGQTVIGINGLFKVGGYETTAPQHFGIASEDINCTCDYKMEYLERVETDLNEYKRYKESK